MKEKDTFVTDGIFGNEYPEQFLPNDMASYIKSCYNGFCQATWDYGK